MAGEIQQVLFWELSQGDEHGDSLNNGEPCNPHRKYAYAVFWQSDPSVFTGIAVLCPAGACPQAVLVLFF